MTTSVAKDAIGVLVARILIRGAQFLTFVLLARVLSPADFGWFGIVTTAISLGVTLGSLGLRQSIAFQTGQGRIGQGEAIGTSLVAWPLLAVATASVLYMLCGRSVSGMTSANALAAIVVATAASMLVTILQGVFLGRGDITSFNHSETLPRVVLAGLTVVLFLRGATSLEAVWAYGLSFLLVAPWTLRLAFRGAGALSFRPSRLPEMVRYGGAFAFNLFLTTLCARVSMFIVGSHAGAAEAGQVFAAVRVTDIGLEVATAFGLVVFSKTVRKGGGGFDVEDARMACRVFWGFGVVAIAMAALGPWMLALLLGEEYVHAAGLLRILSLGLCAAAANKVIYSAIAGRGNPYFGSPVIAGSLLVNAVLAWVLVPVMGAAGGAVGLVAGQFVMLAGYIVGCRARFGVSAREFLVPELGDVAMVRVAIRSRWMRLLNERA